MNRLDPEDGPKFPPGATDEQKLDIAVEYCYRTKVPLADKIVIDADPEKKALWFRLMRKKIMQVYTKHISKN